MGLGPSSSIQGIRARSQQDTQDLWMTNREPELSLQLCHQPSPAPGGVSHPQLMWWGRSGLASAGAKHWHATGQRWLAVTAGWDRLCGAAHTEHSVANPSSEAQHTQSHSERRP